LKIKFKIINPSLKIIPPVFKTDGSAGMDISSASKEEIIISPGETALIHTNFSIEIPRGYEGQVRPRSGLALKHGITVLNSPGTIDSDYRGEVKVLLINHGKENFSVKSGDRIAQLIIAKYEKADIDFSTELTDTKRGERGYGSTGVNHDER